MKIAIRVGPLTMHAELNDTPTAHKVAAALPKQVMQEREVVLEAV